MTTLELYSIFESSVIASIKSLKNYLESEVSVTVRLNDPEFDPELNDANYQLRFNTLFTHNYDQDKFVSDQIPDQKDALILYKDEYTNSQVPLFLCNLCNTFYPEIQNVKEIDINIGAYLLANNKDIGIEVELYPFDAKRYEKVTWKLDNWREALRFFLEYVFDTFENE